jgi:hypothetical protein
MRAAALTLLVVFAAIGVSLTPTTPPPKDPQPARRWWACTGQIINQDTPPECLTTPQKREMP